MAGDRGTTLPEAVRKGGRRQMWPGLSVSKASFTFQLLASSSRRRDSELWVDTPWSWIMPRRLSTSSSCEGVPSVM
eukprot:1998593-Prymnesium_polylepis.2